MCSTGGIVSGAVRQAFCGALQAELAEYFRLIANLEARTQFAIPSAPNLIPGEENAPYLTLRRLRLALAAPLRILRTLVSNGFHTKPCPPPPPPPLGILSCRILNQPRPLTCQGPSLIRPPSPPIRFVMASTSALQICEANCESRVTETRAGVQRGWAEGTGVRSGGTGLQLTPCFPRFGRQAWQTVWPA